MNKLLEKYKDNEQAQRAINLLFDTNDTIFLTGRAGTGKSTLLREITEVITKSYVVLAPTGVAALNVGGQTIHSFFHLSQKPYAPQDADIELEVRKNSRKRKLINSLDLIIIDEISMVRADTMCAIDYSLRLFTGTNYPFGGKQLLLIGDLYQLPPVVQSNNETEKEIIEGFYKTSYFFSATAFESPVFDFHTIELEKVYRQSDADFIDLLNAVRDKNITDAQLAQLNKLADVPKQNTLSKTTTITIATTNKIVDTLNDTRLKALTTPFFKFEAELDGDFLKKASLPTNITLELKVGAQIMFVKNEHEQKKWVNGDLGKILYISHDYIEIEIDRNKITHKVERAEWQSYKYEFDPNSRKITKIVTGTFIQFPIKLAWAVTIHKSQGQTFDDVIIDLGYGAFAAGQLYVALSRCRTMQGIRLTKKIEHRDIIVNKEISVFLRRIAEMHKEVRQKELSNQNNLFQ